ncbi:MAG TPA: 2-isopropylmalate synthase [Deltaproteobacteria bacterium]|nr:2-isopropylmalate synthase [Deltaproteobacteria bacterium]
MPAGRYSPFSPVDLPDRRWPSRRIERAPRWCSVDLRDGNQALVEPMGWVRKIRLFETLVAIGFREIEVGFPSASQTEFDFVRRLIEEGRIPDSVTIQVLTPCRDDLIERTFEAIEGARRSIVHFYNSTSPLQRRVVFGSDRKGIEAIAVRGAERVKAGARSLPAQEIRFEYSPESFTSTEPDFSVEICRSVMQVLEATPDEPVILNLPATVEVSTPNVHADQIEWFGRHLREREAAIVSVHPHNDRGCGVAAAELALLAGAERVEGTLFGNGERTGNVDLVTLALNMMSQGIDPELDLRDLPALVRRVEAANRLPVHPRHPYAGELVFTAFSGSHQDAIRKGLGRLHREGRSDWEVPYLPVDPADLGRTYETVIRINSQSGKGGVAHVLETDSGHALPRRMQIEFSKAVQRHAEETGAEISADQIRTLFEREYLGVEGGPRLAGDRRLERHGDGSRDVFQGILEWGRERHALSGQGAGPIDAFVEALNKTLGIGIRVGDDHEHALGAGAAAMAVAYVEVVFAPDKRLFGAGVAASIVEASFSAVLSAIARAAGRGWIEAPTGSERKALGGGAT